MRELHHVRSGRLTWHERDVPEIRGPGDALVRPFVAGRCDGDTLPLHRPVSRALQAGIRLGLLDPVVATICGPVPFKGRFPIGHEAVAEVTSVGPDVRHLTVGQRVIVPWAVSCGTCPACRRGLTSKCHTTIGPGPGPGPGPGDPAPGSTSPAPAAGHPGGPGGGALAAFGFGPSCGPWGGLIADLVRIPYADHLLVPVPDGVPALRVAAASDNLADAWRAVVPPLAGRPGGSVLVLGGGAKSIGLYAAGLAVAHGAAVVDYLDDDTTRLDLAAGFGAHPLPASGTGRRGSRLLRHRRYDVVVEAASRASALRLALQHTAPGGICTAVGYYLATTTRLPVMHMYATDVTLHAGVSHPRTVLPDLLDFIHRTQFPAERVTTLTADWDDAAQAYATRTTKLVLYRAPLTPAATATDG